MNKFLPKSGNLLVAEPFMADPNFARSVILLCEHNNEGSFGLIVNRPIDITLDEVLPDVAGFNVELFYGGPCEKNTLHYLHTYSDVPDSVEVFNGLYWGGNFGYLKHNINLGLIDSSKIKFFLGYSGWSTGQLKGELKRNDWFLNDTPTTVENVLSGKPEQVWQQIMVNMGGEYVQMANYPVDPRLN